jgi:hypothetical protein
VDNSGRLASVWSEANIDLTLGGLHALNISKFIELYDNAMIFLRFLYVIIL